MITLDERRHARIETNLPVAVRFVDGRRIRWATNLGGGGLRLRRGIEDVMAGDEVELSFRLPDGTGHIDCNAEVVYDADGFVGLRFTYLSAPQREALLRCIGHDVG